MKYDIRKNWLSTVETIIKHPVIILPFIFIAFLESLMLELVYFSVRYPISVVATPIVRKFFGSGFLHYPAHLVLLPKLFYYGQVVIYVLIGVFLTAITVNIFKNTREGLPVKLKALVNNAFKRYAAFFIYGIVMVALLAITQKAGSFIFAKSAGLVSRYFTDLPALFYRSVFLGGQFVLHIMLQVFLVLTIPFIVLEKKPFLSAFFGSVLMGLRNFFKIFAMIFVPYLIYLPIMVLRSDPTRLINRTFPEITVVIAMAGIIIAPLVDCFIIVCASQFLLDKRKAMEKST